MSAFTSHSATSVEPTAVTGGGLLVRVAALTVHSLAGGLWLAVLADVENVRVSVRVDDDRIEASMTDILGVRGAYGFPGGAGRRRRWWRVETRAGIHTIGLFVGAPDYETGRVRRWAIYAASEDPQGAVRA